MNSKRTSLWRQIIFEAVLGALAFSAITAVKYGWADVPRFALVGALAGILIGVGRWYMLKRALEKDQQSSPPNKKKK